MKIVHLIDSIDPADGGPPVIMAKLAAAQAKMGHEVHTIAHTSDPRPHERHVFGDDLDAIPAPNRHWAKPVGGFGAIKSTEALGYLDKLLPGADFVHLHSVWRPIIPRAASRCRKAGVPYTVLLNGMLDPWTLTQKPLKKHIALAVAYKTMLNGSAFLHCGNTDEVNLIKPLGLRTDTKIIPNGMSPKDIDELPEPGAFRAAHPEIADKPFILFLSRLHYKKGLDILADAFIDAAPKMPGVQLVVAGPDGGMRQDFESRIRAGGLTDRVHMTGPLYDTDKWNVLVDADCFCLPSRQEGFSMAITEALGASRPCIVTADCHYPEVGEVSAGEVTKLDPLSVSEAMQRVMAPDADRKAMGERGSRLILDRFTWPKVAERSLDLYQEYVGKNAG